MPVEVFDKVKFIELSEKASECTIKRNKDNTKLKLRTPRYLYTIKLDPAEADELAEQLSCPTSEV